MKSDKNSKLVYSTNPEELHEKRNEPETSVPNDKQNLTIQLEKRGRKGKTVTLVRGFKGSEKDLQELGRLLKTKCGVGGSAKDGEILIQGDLHEKIMQILITEGFKVKSGKMSQ